MTNERDKRIAAEVERLQGEEAHKRMLYDRTIGGPMVPRPSEKFIRENVGELKNEKQISDEATQRVDKQMAVEAADAQRRAEVERSMRGHTASIANDRQEPRPPREYATQSQRDRLNSDERGSMRDQLRNNRNGRDGLER